MTEEKMGKQGGKWSEMMMGMLDNMTAVTSSNKVIEPFVELTKMQARQGMDISQAWMDQLWKIGEASRSGDVKKVLATCAESNMEILNTCQEALKEQAKARHELLRTFIPTLPGFPGTRS